MTNPSLTPANNNLGKPDGVWTNSTRQACWLYVAFLPSLTALALAGAYGAGNTMTLPLMVLNALCGALAGWGILHGVKNVLLHTIITVILTAFFFSANLIVSEFTGCCSGGAYH